MKKNTFLFGMFICVLFSEIGFAKDHYTLSLAASYDHNVSKGLLVCKGRPNLKSAVELVLSRNNHEVMRAPVKGTIIQRGLNLCMTDIVPEFTLENIDATQVTFGSLLKRMTGYTFGIGVGVPTAGSVGRTLMAFYPEVAAEDSEHSPLIRLKDSNTKALIQIQFGQATLDLTLDHSRVKGSLPKDLDIPIAQLTGPHPDIVKQGVQVSLTCKGNSEFVESKKVDITKKPFGEDALSFKEDRVQLSYDFTLEVRPYARIINDMNLYRQSIYDFSTNLIASSKHFWKSKMGDSQKLLESKGPHFSYSYFFKGVDLSDHAINLDTLSVKNDAKIEGRIQWEGSKITAKIDSTLYRVPKGEFALTQKKYESPIRVEMSGDCVEKIVDTNLSFEEYIEEIQKYVGWMRN